MTPLWNDICYALRQLRKSPGFAVTAVLTLALGIGATSAIYTVVDSVVLQPLAFRNFQRLVNLQTPAEYQGQRIDLGMSAGLFRLYRERCSAFDSIAIYRASSQGLSLSGGGVPKEIEVVAASPSLFSVLETSPMLGRGFSPEEYAKGRNKVVVISAGMWRSEFHSDRSIIGKSVPLHGIPYVVVGVLPPDFRLPPQLMGTTASGVRRGADAFTPLVLSEDSSNPLYDFNYVGIARLKKGATPQQADAQMNAILAPLMATEGGSIKGRARAVALRKAINGEAERGLWLLLGAVGSVLLIACINLANMQLARARVRAREHAIRAALGASGARLFQHSLIESMLLALAGGAAGTFLAIAGVKAFLLLAPTSLPRAGQVHVRWETLAASAMLGIGTGLFFGLAPAWAALRSDPQQALHQGSSRTIGGRPGFRSGLIMAEVAVSAVLLMAAALLTRSFVRLMTTDLGFAPQRIVAAEVDLGDKRFEAAQARIQFYRRVLPILRHLPGVSAAAFVSALPMQGDIWVAAMSVPGESRPEWSRPEANYRWISPGYLAAIDVPLISGRMLTQADLGTNNVVISQSAARKTWPNQNPLGHTFSRGGDHLTVVGVVGDTHSRGLSSPADVMVYEPYTLMTTFSASGYLMVRTAGDPRAIASSIERAIWSVDPSVPIPEVRTLPDVIRSSVALEHFEMLLLLAFGLAALALAALGIYGVLAVGVAERTRDLAVRIALGADKPRMLRLVLRQGMRPVLAGLLLGLFCAWLLAHAAQSLLPDVSPYDPAASAITVLLLAAVALIACQVPARRAASLDPNTVLRAE